MSLKCPFCGSTNIEAPFVDNGVGMEQVGPYGCDDCHAVQLEYPDVDGQNEEERSIGWRRGDTFP